MASDVFARNVLEMQTQGYALFEGMLTRNEAQEAEEALDRIFEAERNLFGVSQSEFAAQAYNLMNKARIFERFYQLPELLRFVRYFLGDDAVLSSMQAHRVSPGAPAQALHYDGILTGPFKSFADADADTRMVSHALGFNIVFCISEFTLQNGATRVVPGSHLYPKRDIPQALAAAETIVEAPRGSVLAFNIATWHGASANRSETVRHAVMTPWRRSWLRPEADLPRIVHPDVLERAGEEGRKIFGYSSCAPYTDRWQWNLQEGRPLREWRHLEREG